MILKEKKILIATSVLVLAMVGLVIIQFKWINRALEVQELQFNSQVGPMLTAIEKRVETDETFLNTLNTINFNSIDPSKKTITTDNVIAQLRKIIDEARQEHELLIDYEVGLAYRENRAKPHCIIFSTNEKFNSHILESRYMLGHSIFRNSDGHFNLYFPNKSSYIAKQIWGLLIGSLIFILIIIVCFIYAIYIIKRQKKLSEIKDDFINNLTHEFKTPIFSISLAVKTLLGKKEKGTDYTKYLEVINAENSRLKNQVDKILQIALIDSGKFELDKSNVDIHAVIKEVVNRFELILNDNKGRISVDLNATKNFLKADVLHLSNIIYNLIDNALKYCEKTPDILISTKDTEKGICLTIKDNGMGMDAHTQDFVFDKFYRAHTGNVHNVKGFGLGLSYVRKIVEAHKGHISFVSSPDEGTEFSITFPQ